MYQLIKSIDQANGYVFGGHEDDKSNFSQLMSSAVGSDFEFFRSGIVSRLAAKCGFIVLVHYYVPRSFFFLSRLLFFFFLSTKSTLILIQCGLGLFVAFPISLQLSASARRRDITLESCTRLGLLFETSFHTRCSLQVLC